MDWSDLVRTLGWCVFPVLIIAFLKGYISSREYWTVIGWIEVIRWFAFIAEREISRAAVAVIFIALCFWMASRADDDDDPRNKRKRLAKKAGKKLPRPQLVQIRPVGAT